MKKHALFMCMVVLWASSMLVQAQVVVDVSGGGTGVLAAKMVENALTGCILRITDSAIYTETTDLYLGPTNSANGRLGFSIEAAAGTSPTLVLSGCGIVSYASSGDWHVGSAAGGRIIVDASTASAAGSGAMAWNICTENGAAAGAASVVDFENLDVTLGAAVKGWVMGSAIDDLALLTTPTLNLTDLTVTGGETQLWMTSSQPAYPAVVNVTRCQLYEAAPKAVMTENGLGVQKALNITDSIIYSTYNTVSPLVDTGMFLTYGGQITIDHCDLVAPNCPRVVYAIFGAGYTVTNSIIHGGIHSVQTIANTQTCSLQNCNAGSTDAPFTDLGGNLAEWPVYAGLGTDLTDSANFAVRYNALSRTADDAGEPLGSRGLAVEGLPVIHVSGGGTNVLSDAIAANPAGGVIVIDDSLEYVQTADLYVGPHYSATYGRCGFSIEAAAGENPTITLTGCGFLVYAAGGDFHVGSALGGRIAIDATAANAAGAGAGLCWYINMEDGLTGQACVATFENLDINSAGAAYGFYFGSGADTVTPAMTSPTLALQDVTMVGGQRLIFSSMGPAGHGTLISVEQSMLYDASYIAFEVASGRGLSQKAVFDHSIIYMDNEFVADDGSGAIIMRGGSAVIDHCDIIAEATTPAMYGIAAVDANVAVTNSIVRGYHGTLMYNSAVCTLENSNVTASLGVPNNFAIVGTNVFSEWPVYADLDADLSIDTAFAVNPGTTSRTADAMGDPLGSRGPDYTPAELSIFLLD